MKPPVVVYIITKLELGGAQKVCLDLFYGMQKSGLRSFLISGSEGILQDKVVGEEGVILLESLVREVSFRGMLKEIKNFFNLTCILRVLRKKYPHLIVHTHSTKAGLIGRWAAWAVGVKERIHTVHGYGFHVHQSLGLHFLLKLTEFITSFITTRYVFVSSADIEIGRAFIPFFDKKCEIIRAAIDDARFNPVVLNTSELADSRYFIIGSIACFKPQKNLLELLQAFLYARRYNNKLILEIIGDGAQRSMLEMWINYHKLESVVVLHGWRHDVEKVMNRWQVFALSSLWEGLPCAVVEARRMKLPVVCYDTGGIKDVIFHGKNGLLVDQGDWKELGRALTYLSKNREKYEQMARYPEDLGNFERNTMIESHYRLYAQAL